ncbi:MAG: hypothetical protein Q8P52_01530, partial [bacterium]|nr:hypothetical protein [bacterium]
KGDCFEGGYTYESLYVLGGLQNLDKTPSGSWKGNEPLVPSEATLIVFEKDEVKDVGSPAEGEKTEGNSDSESGFPLVLLAVVGLVSIAFGFLLGKIPFKTEVANNPKEGGQSGNFPESGRR